jgi:hypothetical protein
MVHTSHEVRWTPPESAEPKKWLRPAIFGFGAEDGIRAGDPHLGKVAGLVHGVLSSPVACCSVQPVSTQSTGFALVVDRSTTSRQHEIRRRSLTLWRLQGRRPCTCLDGGQLPLIGKADSIEADLPGHCSDLLAGLVIVPDEVVVMKAKLVEEGRVREIQDLKGVTLRGADRAPYLERIDPLVDKMTKEFGPGGLLPARGIPDTRYHRPGDSGLKSSK